MSISEDSSSHNTYPTNSGIGAQSTQTDEPEALEQVPFPISASWFAPKGNPRVYSDLQFYDVIRSKLFHPASGNHVLALSLLMQVLMLLFLFLGHHYQQTNFGCCNAWAVFVAILFLGLQWPYYADWCAKFGFVAEWHRANLFAPLLLFNVLFVMWLAGALSVLAHTEGTEFFRLRWGELDGLEVAGFIICTSTFVIAAYLLIVLAYTHRNNLATHFYGPNEGPYCKTPLFLKPHPTPGSFHYRHLLVLMARLVGCDNSADANHNIRYVIFASTAAQALFYLFAFIVYGEGNRSQFLIVFVAVAAGFFIYNLTYAMQAYKGDPWIYRAWNRINLFHPIHSLNALVAVYFFTMSTMFFKTAGTNSGWDDLIKKLDKTETAYFALDIIFVFIVYFLQHLLTQLHLKAWTEGTADIDDGFTYASKKPRSGSRSRHRGPSASKSKSNLRRPVNTGEAIPEGQEDDDGYANGAGGGGVLRMDTLRLPDGDDGDDPEQKYADDTEDPGFSVAIVPMGKNAGLN